MEFNEYLLKDIATIIMGQSPKSEYYSDVNGTPFLQGNRTFNNLYPTIDTYTTKITKTAEKNDILFSVRAPVGEVNIAPFELCIGRGLSAIRSKNKDNKFLHYLLIYKLQDIHSKSTGTIFNSINKSTLENLEIKIPNEKFQKFIGTLLRNIDNKIELNNKIISNLEELSQTLFKRWFVDFEFPDENGNPYKSSGGKMIDSELGKIPNDWKISNFQEITAFNTEMVDTNQLENPLNYIGLEHISRNNIISIDRWENTSKVTGKKLKVCKGDILFGKLRPYFQKVGISPIDGVVSTDIMIFTPSFKNVYYFILLYLSQKNFIRYITSTSTGTRMPRTGKKQINSYKIVLPTNLILTSFNTILNRYTNLIDLLINENAKLIQLRDTLLPKLMSGELEIPDDVEVNTDELSI